jgi:hypothetical protein
MEGFSFVTPVIGLNRLNTGKEDDDDDYDDVLYYMITMNSYYISQSINDLSVSKLCCGKVYGGRLQYLAYFCLCPYSPSKDFGSLTPEDS